MVAKKYFNMTYYHCSKSRILHAVIWQDLTYSSCIFPKGEPKSGQICHGFVSVPDMTQNRCD